MTNALAGVVKQQAFQLGVSSPGAVLRFFLSGTSTPQEVFSEAGVSLGTTLTADANGTFAPFFFAPVTYRVRLDDALGATIWGPIDGIYDLAALAQTLGVNTDIIVTAGENLSAGAVAYVSDGSGALIAGRAYRADADLPYASSEAAIVGIVPIAITSGATGVLRAIGRVTGLASLSTGSTYVVSSTAGALAIDSDSTVYRRVLGQADSSTSIVLAAIPAPLRKLQIVTVPSNAAAYIAVTADDVIKGAGTWTLTLYAASGNAGRRLTIKNTGTGVITLDGNGAETIDGLTTFTVSPASTVQILCDGSNWITYQSAAVGTWTPVIGGSGGASGQTYTLQTGSYVKNGPFVTAWFNAALTAKGTITTNVQIQGLPFTISTAPDGNILPTGSLRWISLASTFVNMQLSGVPNTTAATIIGLGAASANFNTPLTTTDLNDTSQFIGVFIYRATQ